MFATVVNLAEPGNLVQSLRSHPVFPLVEWRMGVTEPLLGERLPLLYVGHAATEVLLGQKLGAVQNQLDERTWWAYSPAESPMYFLRQFEAFLHEVPHALQQCVSWRYLDPLIHGPYEASTLVAYLQAMPEALTVFEHRFGWCWWSPGEPGVVTGIGADMYYAHTGLTRPQLRVVLQAAAAKPGGQYVEDGPEARISAWFRSRFNYSSVDIVRMVPWLMAMKGKRAI